jgi:signal transduction histidine kinase
MNVTAKNFLLRIIQEFIQNSLKHSGCEKITVTLNHTESGLMIMVSDDGKGFDLHTIKSEGIGLSNMERRIKIIGGTFDLQSQPGKGTVLNLYIPFKILNQPII